MCPVEASVLFDSNKYEVELNDTQYGALRNLLEKNDKVVRGAKYSLVEVDGKRLCVNGSLTLNTTPKSLEMLFEQIAILLPKHVISLDIYDPSLNKGKTIKYTGKETSSFEY